MGNSSQGKFDPTGAKINFAVPSKKTLKKESEVLVTLPRLLEPGLLPTMLDSFAKDNESWYVLSFDGKLLRCGLTPTSGDVDTFGIENGPLLAEQKARLHNETTLADIALATLDTQQDDLLLSNLEKKNVTIEHSRGLVKTLTTRIQEVRQKKLGKEIHLRNLLKQVRICSKILEVIALLFFSSKGNAGLLSQKLMSPYPDRE